MWKQEENPYKGEAERIHAPKDLVDRTRMMMQEEAKRMEGEKKNQIRRWRAYAAAACIGILFLGGYGGYRYRADNFINIGEVAAEENLSSWTAGMSLGQITEKDKDGGTGEDEITLISGPDKNIAPEQLWEISASRIKGNDIYIGYDRQKKVFYAAWEKEGAYWFASAGEITEESFLKYLKENI